MHCINILIPPKYSGSISAILLALLLKDFIVGTAGKRFVGSRIVGGEEARPNEFPFMAALLSTNNAFACGATILSPQWILTAAHCVTDLTANQIRVVAGAHDLRNLPPTSQTVQVMAVFSHPGFNFPATPNDIALLQLQNDLTFGDTIGAVDLAPQGYIINLEAQLIGWGQASRNTSIQTLLQKITVPVVDHDTCVQAFQNIAQPNEQVTDTMICFGGEAGRGACNGDSGGPAICTSPCGPGFVQCGIASYGGEVGNLECGTAGIPDVYTRITTFLDYILTTIADNSRPNNPRRVRDLEL